MIGYEVVDAVRLQRSRVVAYRTNGGATTDFGIRITHEMPVLPGVILVRDLHKGSHESTAALKVLRPGIVEATINKRVPVEYAVRPSVYF